MIINKTLKHTWSICLTSDVSAKKKTDWEKTAAEIMQRGFSLYGKNNKPTEMTAHFKPNV